MDLANSKLFQTGAYIGGQWITKEETFNVYDPGTKELLSSVSKCGKKEALMAIDAAEKAYASFRNSLASERETILRRWADLLIANKDDIAKMMILEQGKTQRDALGEINYAASFFYWFAEESRRAYGEIIPPARKGTQILTLRQPVGVVALLTPWNFPVGMLTRKIGPALAAGCTTVIRPSSEVPLAANALVVLGEEAGVPPGVVNIVAGGHDITDVFCESSKVKKLSFTGSTSVGKMLVKKCSDTLKKVSMELGGNAPFIVFDDAEMDNAVDNAMIAKFRNSGQSCIAANRFYIQEEIYEQFIERFVAQTKDLKLGHGLDNTVTVGPLINTKAVEELNRLLDDALSKGARVLTGGSPSELGTTYFEPTVIRDCKESMLVAEDELFGPLATFFSFKNENEVIEIANNTPYGLASYVCTSSLSRSWRMAEKLEVGLVGVNEGFISNAAAPFGGVKESGLGREGAKHGLDDYMEIKYVLMGGIDA